ncbi:MAG: hypothetical protein ABW223_11110 [Rariglobus sp.]
MKVLFLLPVFLAATQFVLPVSAETDVAARDAEILKRYDTNKDRKLDEAEVAAVKEEMLMQSQKKDAEKRNRRAEREASWLAEFDRNADGRLDDAEKATMDATVRARMEKRPQILKRFDTDGDGKLSDAEWAAGREKIFARINDAKDKRAK